ncbi:MAG: hypothetical protein ACFFCO_02385 [Promethearchaeota archaeon]
MDEECTVREVGLIALGVSLVRKQYHQYESATQESELILRDGLVSAIETFARTVLKDQVETFLMTDQKILIMAGEIFIDNREEAICVYAICDRAAPEKRVREALSRIHTAFLSKYPKVSGVVSLERYSNFAETIDAILGDLVLRPQDRLDRLL